MLVLWISIILTIADQATKYWVRSSLRDHVISVFPGLFDLRFVRNTGAAWGMFQGFSSALVVLSVVVLAVLLVFRRRFLTDTFLHRLTLGFMVGGILGNLIDRMRLSYVVDFLDFHWRGHHFPAFNIADAAICTGVFIYILTTYMEERAQPSEVTDRESEGSSAG